MRFPSVSYSCDFRCFVWRLIDLELLSEDKCEFIIHVLLKVLRDLIFQYVFSFEDVCEWFSCFTFHFKSNWHSKHKVEPAKIFFVPHTKRNTLITHCHIVRLRRIFSHWVFFLTLDLWAETYSHVYIQKVCLAMMMMMMIFKYYYFSSPSVMPWKWWINKFTQKSGLRMKAISSWLGYSNSVNAILRIWIMKFIVHTATVVFLTSKLHFQWIDKCF